jgi:ABC-type antimicrobial peptide transport system permease subunit
VFALLGVSLAAAGVYGVFSRVVEQQTREMGVRLALGASPAQVAATVLGEALRLAAVGLALGLVAAMFLMRLLATLLYGVEPHDAVTFSGCSALLLTVALIACWVPARRAARLDPAITLRYE